MAISYSFKWLPLLLAAALLISIASADQALINSICSKTRNQALCFKVFSNSAYSPVADRRGLGQISSHVAWIRAQSTLSLAKMLAQKATDRSTRGQYKTCLEVYNDAVNMLDECKTAFNKNDMSTANVRASAADTDVDTCSDEGTNVAPELKRENLENQDYINIILVVSNANP